MTNQDILEPVRLFIPSGTLHVNFTIIGCGALGRATAELLVRSGAQSLTLYDHDVVERRNLSLQHFSEADVGKAKTVALADCLKRELPSLDLQFTPHTCDYFSQPLTDVVIATPDNIEARQDVMKEASASDHVHLLVDGRTHMDSAQIFTVRPGNMAGDAIYYADKLESDMRQQACSNPLLPPIVSAIMVSQVVKFMRGQPYYRGIYLSLGVSPRFEFVDLIDPCDH